VKTAGRELPHRSICRETLGGRRQIGPAEQGLGTKSGFFGIVSRTIRLRFRSWPNRLAYLTNVEASRRLLWQDGRYDLPSFLRRRDQLRRQHSMNEVAGTIGSVYRLQRCDRRPPDATGNGFDASYQRRADPECRSLLSSPASATTRRGSLGMTGVRPHCAAVAVRPKLRV